MPAYDSYILREDGGYIVLEDGSGFYLRENAQPLGPGTVVVAFFDETEPAAQTFDRGATG